MQKCLWINQITSILSDHDEKPCTCTARLSVSVKYELCFNVKWADSSLDCSRLLNHLLLVWAFDACAGTCWSFVVLSELSKEQISVVLSPSLWAACALSLAAEKEKSVLQCHAGKWNRIHTAVLDERNVFALCFSCLGFSDWFHQALSVLVSVQPSRKPV